MIHGTLTGYHHHKCRCVECQRAHREYRRAHDVSQRAKQRLPRMQRAIVAALKKLPVSIISINIDGE
jgi:hypothetical protein